MHPRRDPPPAACPACAADSRERGMALLVVLWIIASAALLVSAFNVIARSGASFAASEVQLSKTEALLDAGVEIAASQLLGEEDQRGWQPDGQPRVVPYAGVDLVISVRDPNGLVDLNQADGELLLSLFQRQGAPEALATALRDQILRARGESTPQPDAKKPSTLGKPAATSSASGKSQDDSSGKGGTESKADEAKEAGPNNERRKPHAIVFIDPRQLRQLAGMSLPLYRALFPLVTVYSRDGRVNLLTAPEGVLASLPNLSRIDVARVRDAARSRLRNPAVLDDVKQRAGESVSDEAGPAYIVRVELASGQRYRAAREFVIAVGIDEAAPFRLIAKRTVATAD